MKNRILFTLFIIFNLLILNIKASTARSVINIEDQENLQTILNLKEAVTKIKIYLNPISSFRKFCDTLEKTNENKILKIFEKEEVAKDIDSLKDKVLFKMQENQNNACGIFKKCCTETHDLTEQFDDNPNRPILNIIHDFSHIMVDISNKSIIKNKIKVFEDVELSIEFNNLERKFREVLLTIE